jgi:hypothetical protein
LKLAYVLESLKKGQFNCSEGAQLLAEQPTLGEESHAHMHSLDPFKVDVSKIKPEAFKAPSTVLFNSLVQERKQFWENPELHLHPEGSHPHKSQVFDPSSTSTTFKPYEFYVDKTRLAVNDTYLKRGMSDIAEKKELSYTQQIVYKEKDAPKPTSQLFKLTSKTDKPALPTGAKVVKDLGVKETEIKIHPAFMAMDKHSMFEDSEVLVMATTAVILSDAGLLALSELKTRAAGNYVAVFSASGVKAVETSFLKHKATAPLKQVERSPTNVKVDTTGKQPQVVTTGATYEKVDMKRVVLVVKKDATGDLIIVTCYPSQKTPTVIHPTPPPTADDDVVEVDKSTNDVRIVKQVGPIELKWS